MIREIYGYWLTPSGDLSQVAFQEHNKMAMSFGFYEKPIVEAILAGNIRIITAPKEIFVSIHTLTLKQKIKLVDLVRESESKDIIMDINGRVYRPDNYLHLEYILSEF